MLKLIVGSVLGGVGLAVAAAGAAFAAGGDGGFPVSTTPTGYAVHVQYSGTAAPKQGTAGKSIPSVPPKCWWKTFLGGDPASVAKGVDDQYSGPLYSGKEYLLLYGDKDRFKQAVDSKAAVTWYIMECAVPYTDKDALAYAGASRSMWGQTWPILVRAFPNGQAPPAPLVDPEALRDAAYAAMEIPKPTIQRNPKMVGSNATLVNLPTWFWVNQADRGPYDITASAGPVSATIVVKSSAWNLFSAFGATTCTEQQITTAYAAGMSDDQACTLSFAKASSGAGHQVRLITQWGATWSGVRADGSAIGPLGGLADKTTESAVNVPVIEVQVPNNR
jgi:hypothetical protein